MGDMRLLDARGEPLRRPQAALTDLTKEQRITLSEGGTVGFFAGRTASGVNVTMDSALSLSTVWACIRTAAQVMAALPLNVFRKTPSGRERIDTDVSDLITYSPNADQTGEEFWEGMLSWLLATGNAYAEIEYVGTRPVALLPWSSTQVRPFRQANGQLRYEIRSREGLAPRVVDPKSILHLRGWGFGGDLGMSPIRWGAQSLGAAIAADESSAKTFGAGLQPSGILKGDHTLNDVQREQMKDMMEAYSSSGKGGKMMVLEAGYNYEQLSLNPDDAQMLETRRFSIEEVCRWFGVPPMVVGHSAEGQTMWGSGVEQIFISWLQLGINPLLRKVEARIRKSLIAPADRGRVYAEFNREALLQMDSKAKAEYLRAMVSNGIMTRDEARDKLNLQRMGGAAADLLVQSAMLPIEELGKVLK